MAAVGTLAPAGACPPDPDMVWVPGGTFAMGSEHHFPEEAPVHAVTVDGFWMDRYAVTNARFARFVAATGYVTLAERSPQPELYPHADRALLVPGGGVFRPVAGVKDLRDYHQWWAYVPGASWRHPRGPQSDLEGLEAHPVVQVAWEDAAAYCAWAGKSLPSEAQWERAARGGLEGKTFAWGDELMPEGRIMANTWFGRFPCQQLSPHGFVATAPVGHFPPNGFGLFEMTGNVWEWTADGYQSRHHPGQAGGRCCAPLEPRGSRLEHSLDPRSGLPRAVIKGGSYLCSPDYCFRFRPAARSPQTLDTAICHLGFRCIVVRPGECAATE